MSRKPVSSDSSPAAPPRADQTASSAVVDQLAAVSAVQESVTQTGRWRDLLSPRGLTSFGVSCGFHAALIVLLSLLVSFVPARQGTTLIVTSQLEDDLAPQDLNDARELIDDTRLRDAAAALEPLDVPSTLRVPLDRLLQNREPATGTTVTGVAPREAVQRSSRLPAGGGFQGRTGGLKARMLGSEGGTDASENAVQLGLAWLAAHQWQDGGWRLDLSRGPCENRCRDSGKVATSTGATGLALLPFLGAGHTHLSGDYRDVVHNGLYYLRGRIEKTPYGADLQEGTMYAQGIATIALCEAYAMTQDPELREPAQQAIEFICHAQHSGGGWRYFPGQPGDTTVFGWQMMALKSATMAGLDVPSPVIPLGERFLDSVQSGNGAYYGYMIRGRNSGPTAVGLLIRMYTGWQRDDERLRNGVMFLANEGPSPRDMYFNYYATQVLHHYGQPYWEKWNETMREHLIKTQESSGHARGSWFFVDQHGSQGGRLYTTAMCTMILEVYYRHMPLYAEPAVDDDWW